MSGNPIGRAAAVLACLLLVDAAPAAAAPTILHVTLGAASRTAVSGRLLVFAEPLADARAAARDGRIDAVDAGEFHPRAVAVAAQEVHDLQPGQAIDLDADLVAFPQPFSRMKPGRYAVQAVLDPDHGYDYRGRHAGDLLTPVVEMDLPAANGALALSTVVPPRDRWTPPPGLPADRTASLARQLAALKPVVQPFDVESAALTRFWGRPIPMRGWVVLPPGYADGQARYPTVFWTHGFGGTLDNSLYAAAAVNDAMAKHEMPGMIWVFLDESSPTGTHEFADSANDGPWGEALTTELIPELERRYRMDARPSGRFLNGHSSGGWATLWLQCRYPAVFGGTWSTSPDPSDFHDFTGVDLYAPHANVYRRPDGTPYPIMRDHGTVQADLQDFARLEDVLAPYGGQMRSFDWVFSPRGPDGRPEPMFDHDTGAVDPAVVAYWRDHYDIAARLQRDWPSLKPDLDGKVHLVVGTADTFYLDGAAHRLQAVMDGLGARSDFRFLPGRTHFDLYVTGTDRQALLKRIAWEMYAVARPGETRHETGYGTRHATTGGGPNQDGGGS